LSAMSVHAREFAHPRAAVRIAEMVVSLAVR
jgi:hypothetical protein